MSSELTKTFPTANGEVLVPHGKWVVTEFHNGIAIQIFVYDTQEGANVWATAWRKTEAKRREMPGGNRGFLRAWKVEQS